MAAVKFDHHRHPTRQERARTIAIILREIAVKPRSCDELIQHTRGIPSTFRLKKRMSDVLAELVGCGELETIPPPARKPGQMGRAIRVPYYQVRVRVPVAVPERSNL